MKKNLPYHTVLLFFVAISFLASCVSKRKVSYFQDLPASEFSTLDTTAKFSDPVILTDDILSISILTIDPTTSAVANQSSSVMTGSSNSGAKQQIEGFVVDKNGEIELALIGKIKVSGLTTFQARELIRKKASENFKNPIVTVRFANFKISVLGEVGRPATYTLPNERVSVLDVLSLAGDLTLYGRRENVLVIREVDGKKEFGRLNLNSAEIFRNPYYYLRQNDIVYVEPDKAKASALNAPARNTVGIILSAITVAVLAISRL
jgi:polysaccharide export outer membrane protein